MAIITKPNTFTAGATIIAAEHNSNFDTVYNDYNGNITNANVASGAAIGNAKLNLASVAQAVALAGGLTMTARQIDEAKGADVASAATTTIWVTDGNFIHVTGTTTITSFGTATQAGIERIVVFDGILTLTHNSTSLILPTGSNIITAAGDVAIVRAETTANARVINYYRKSGEPLLFASAVNALSGSVIQTVTTNYATYASLGATAFVLDDTIPTWAEGNAASGLDTAITPNNASNILIINVIAHLSATASGGPQAGFIALYQDPTGTDPAIAISGISGAISDIEPCAVILRHRMAAGTTSSTTFKIRAGYTTGTFVINGKQAATAGRVFGGAVISSVIIQKIKA